MAELHRHPVWPHRTIYGDHLRPGDVILETDVYDSTSGKWERATCAGIVLKKGHGAYFVRPREREEKPAADFNPTRNQP